MTRNTRISLAKKYTMAPGHQLHHVYIRAHSTQPQHQYLRVLTEYFSLLPLKSHIQWRKRSGYPLPLSRAASLLAPPHPPLYWHVISWRSSGAAADRHTIYDRAKQLDRSSGSRHPRTKTVHQRVSQHHMTLVDKPLAVPRKRQRQTNRRSPRPHDGRTKKQRENVDLHIT